MLKKLSYLKLFSKVSWSYKIVKLGAGHLQVTSKSLHHPSLISERPGPGAFNYNCNITHPPIELLGAE